MIQIQLPITFAEFAAFWALTMVVIIAIMLISEHIQTTKRNRNGFN